MQVVGIFALVASLVFVGLQMKQSHGIANAERLDESVNIRIARNDLIAANAEIIARANNNAELSQADLIVLDRLVDNLWAEAFFGLRARAVMGSSIGGGVGGRVALSRYLHNNPGVRKVWNASRVRRQESWSAVTGVEPEVIQRFDDEVDKDLARMKSMVN